MTPTADDYVGRPRLDFSQGQNALGELTGRRRINQMEHQRRCLQRAGPVLGMKFVGAGGDGLTPSGD